LGESFHDSLEDLGGLLDKLQKILGKVRAVVL